MTPKSDSARHAEGGFATLQATQVAPLETAPMAPVTETPKARAPALYAIITYKLIKGGLFLALAAIMYSLADKDLPREYQQFRDLLRIQPENRFFANLAVQIGQLTEVRVLWAAVGTFAFSLFSLVEAAGLMCRISWAGWLAIGESAFFVPIELFELSRRFTVWLFVILVVNVAIVWYLFTNRHRLFRHHHPDHH